MRNLKLTIKNSFQQINNGMKQVNESLQLTKGINGETLEYFTDKGVRKVFDIHHYSNGNTILFKK